MRCLRLSAWLRLGPRGVGVFAVRIVFEMNVKLRDRDLHLCKRSGECLISWRSIWSIGGHPSLTTTSVANKSFMRDTVHPFEPSERESLHRFVLLHI